MKSVVSEMVNWADTDQTIFDSQIAQLKWQLQNPCFSDYLSIAKEDSVRVVSEDTLKGEARGLIKRKVDTEKPHFVCADMVDNDEIKKRKMNSVKADDISKNSHCKSKKENLGEKSNSMEREPPQKTQYIHVRARRGQATDSHSLAERVRREKISERMKYLQDLVPGCNRITGKASMLDEIINYVQSLQKQVEFLSMKLADADPQVRRDILQSQSFLGKEINSYSSTSNPRNIASYLLTNPSQQESASHCDLSVNSTNLTDQLASHKVLPDACVEPCFDVCGTSSWTSTEQELCNLDYTQGGESSIPFYLFQIENDLPII